MKLNAATEATILKSTILIFSFLFYSITVRAQVQVSEGFDYSYAGTVFPNQELPFGWQFGRIAPGTDGNNYWERVNAANGTNPTCSPHNGSGGMMRYRSFYCLNVEKAYLVSRPFDLSQRPAGVPSNLRFWMWRDPAAQNDNVEIRVSANPDPTAAGFTTLVDTAYFITTINRPCTSTPPAVTCSGWNLYAFTIPGTFSISNLYVSIIAQNSGPIGSNIYIDDFSIVTYPAAQTFNTLSLEYQNAELVAKNSVNNWILGIRINVSGEAAPINPGAFTFVPNGCTSPGTDISMTKLWFTGGSNTVPTDNNGLPQNAILTASVNPGWPVASWSLTPGVGGTNVQLYNGDNYFWLTYDVPAGAIANDLIDADFISAVIGTTHTCGTSGCTLPGGRQIGIPYCNPVYSLGTSGTNGSYTNNDYIKTVSITNVGGTDPSFTPFYNDHNDKGPNVVGAGYPADPCVTSPTMISGGNSPFSVHPLDYQKFEPVTVPNLCSPGNGSRTCTFIETSVSPPVYNISVQCGTWFGGNYTAAFIDMNHDGDFSDAQEKIFQSTAMTQLSFQNANFQIPTTYGYFGNTTLRVREWYGQPNIDACSPGYYGETEDYTVTLKPPCNPPGWDVWLGYTDDWNTSTNWCGGIPTTATDVLIPQLAVGQVHPVIKSGVVASARKLRIENDTLEISAPAAGSLTIHDSLFINNSSLLRVNYTTDSSIQVSNGVFTNTVFSPFRGSWKEQKMQLMYKSSELLAIGLLDGDVINSICVPIRSRKSTQPYTNVTITVYYAQSGGSYPSFATTGFTTPVPAANALASAFPAVPAAYGVFPYIAYTGSIDMTTIPLNAAGTKDIPLSNPFKFWASANNPLIIEICYDLLASTTDDLVWQTQTVGYRSVLLLAHLTNAQGSGCSFGASTAALNQKQSSDLRPNLCFSFHRDYTKYPINIKGHWKNNGNFIAGNSIVTFNGSANQNIGGATATIFNDLTINNASGVKIFTAAKVEDTLNLKSGKLDLNERTISIFNPGTGGIVRTSGTILSETAPPNYGSVVWKIGTTTGAHLIPFQNAGGKYIPFTYNLTSGNVGTVTVATYHTPPNNLPLPTGVTNINDTNNANNAAFTADRFWDIQKTGPSGKAKLKFTYLNSEAPAPIVNGNLIAQRYNFSNNKWVILPYAITNTVNNATGNVLVTGVMGNNLNSSVWALADAASPLRMMNEAVNEPEVAPNPFTDKITVSLSLNPGNDKTVALTLYTVLGEKAAETTVPAGSFSDGESYEWFPGTVKAGVYFLTIQTKDDIHTVRVVKMAD